MDQRTHSFGYWLRRRRKALDLTQEALAQAVSCSRFAIRKIEADERRPSRSLAERLAAKLAIAPEERGLFLEAARAVRSIARLPVENVPLGNPPAPGEATPFVGRTQEYGLLLGLLARLTAGSGHVALLEGEPGIGKSRLMREVARYCEARGLRCLLTRCYEFERAMAYQPVIELVTRAVEEVAPEALAHLSPVSLAELATLVPAVAERVPVHGLSGDFPQGRQARLFQAIVQLFDTAAGGRQLVVMLDDIQWADDASAQFIHYLARHAAQRPLLIVCAYRDEELDTNERLGALVESLGREAHARHLPLARLAVADAQALVARLQDPNAGPELAERLHRETDGNPFFLTSMLQALAQGEAMADVPGALPLPEALRASVRSRLAHVPAEARAALDVAAVIGRRFDFETLLAAMRKPEDELLTSLELLVRRRLLREDPEEGHFDFSHDKVREVVYRDIVGARRTRLHRAVAEAIEQRAEGEAHERDAWLAEHYERAHAWDEALRYVVRVAERSQALFAMRDALHWLDRAIGLAVSHPGGVRCHDLVELHGRRGAARALAGQADAAVEDFRIVIDDARARGDRGRARDAFIQLGMSYRRADDYERATQCLTEALAESRAMGDERRAADTLYHLGTVMWSQGRNREAIGFHQEAVGLCERLGLADLVAVQAYHGRGEAHYDNLEPAAAIACYERSIELARAIGDRSYESENLMMVGYACTGYMGLADYPRAEAAYRAALEIARNADLQWHIGPTLLGLDHVRGCLGHTGEAREGIEKTLRWLESVGMTRYQLMAYDMLAYLLLDMGLDREAAEAAEEGLAFAGREDIAFWRPRIEANLAIARLRLGDLDVGSALQAALETCERNGTGHQAARCLQGLAELALARRDPHACIAFSERLLAMVEPAGMRELAAEARRLRGEALAMAGDFAGAEADFSRAARLARDIGRARMERDASAALARLKRTCGAASR